MTTRHVIAIPTDEDGTHDGRIVGTATTKAEAIAACEAAGLTVIRPGKGGTVDAYDAEDGPAIYGYDADGMGAFGVTVEA